MKTLSFKNNMPEEPTYYSARTGVSRFFAVRRDTLFGRPYGAWLTIHAGFTQLLLLVPWNSDFSGPVVHLGSPHHDPNIGWHCVRWGIGRWCFNVSKRLQLGKWS